MKVVVFGFYPNTIQLTFPSFVLDLNRNTTLFVSWANKLILFCVTSDEPFLLSGGKREGLEHGNVVIIFKLDEFVCGKKGRWDQY